MRVDDLLRRIDDAVVPPLGRLLDRLRRPTGHTGLLTAVALVSVTAVLATAVWVAQRPREGAPTGEVVRVGVPDGVSVPNYLAESRRELDELSAKASGNGSGDPYALVMFSAYLAPDRLPTVLEGAPVSEVFTRVPLPGMQTQIARMPVHRVPEDVVAGMLLFAERKEREAHDYQDRAAEVIGTPGRGPATSRVRDSGAGGDRRGDGIPHPLLMRVRGRPARGADRSEAAGRATRRARR